MKVEPRIATKSKFPESKIRAVAEQSWWRKTSKKRLVEAHSLTEGQVNELRATPEYQKAVESLMLGQRSAEDFERWVKSYHKRYGDMAEPFGQRMGLDPKVIPGMIERVRRAHAGIAVGRARVPKVVVNSSRKKVDVKVKMELRFCESDISDLANRYTEYQGAYYREREQQVIGLRDDIQRRDYLTKDDLHTVAYWKSHRRAALTLENADAFIKEITTQAFTSTDDWEKLLALTKLRGIGQPTASAILHLYDKGQYPILDIRALWSVGLEGETGPSYPFWLEYIAFCRDIANRNGVDMRTLDRALWFYSHNNGARNYDEV